MSIRMSGISLSSHSPERRKSMLSLGGSISPSRKQFSSRISNATVATSASSASIGNMSDSTAATSASQIPAFSKKFVVVGDGGCGKTCLLISYAHGYFPDKYIPTVFENYITHKPHRASGKSVELALWDTAGQEEYDRLRPLSYPETDLLLVCFAIDCPNSLDNIMDKWYPEVLHFCPTTPIILVGLKSDLRYKKTCIDLLKTQGLTPVTPEQGKLVAEKMEATYMECSSKERRGVEEVFETAIDIAVQTQIAANNQSTSGFSGSSGGRKKKRGCRIL